VAARQAKRGTNTRPDGRAIEQSQARARDSVFARARQSFSPAQISACSPSSMLVNTIPLRRSFGIPQAISALPQKRSFSNQANVRFAPIADIQIRYRPKPPSAENRPLMNALGGSSIPSWDK